MEWSSALVGVAGGMLLSLPIAWLWTRRTERRVRQLEQRAQSAERLAELGTLTGGLAHEIKNPLSTIGLNVQLLHEDLDDLARELGGAEDNEQLGRIHRRFTSLQRETHRLREILEDFLRFAGRMKLALEPSDLNQLVDEVADFFQPQAQEAGVTLRTQLAPSPAIAPADTSLLKQALLNLVLNATQAMQGARAKDKPHGGATELYLRVNAGRILGTDCVEIHVIDTGPGIDEASQPKIFQPYFSTKRGGTGLGLPTTRRIVEEHGGSITVHSEPGRGTDFTVSIPTEPAAPAADAKTPAAG